MLAVVHLTAVRKGVRGGAAAEVGTLLDEMDPKAGFSQRDGGRQPRQTAADY